jgi:uncharacterized protein (TIGR02265 family)
MPRPTIKGIFVNSHVNAVRKKLGDAGLDRLRELFGAPLEFGTTENVPISTEVRLLECAVQLLSPTPVPKDRLAFESGRLHFRNFSTTPLGLMIFAIFRKKFKQAMLQANNLAQHVFVGTRFRSYDLGPNQIRVVMENNDYPVEHFQGFFQEWLGFAHLAGTVRPEVIGDIFEYTIEWT